MTFLAIIVALIFSRVWGDSNPLRNDSWFFSLQSTIRGLGFSPSVGFLIYLGIPVLACLFLLDASESILFGLVWIVLAAGLLLYAFGRGQYANLVERYRSYCVTGDFETASHYAQSVLGMEFGDEAIVSARQVHMAIQRELLYMGYQRWFSVLFYFVVLGPVGALFYRLLQLSRLTPERAEAERLLYFADWIPARLLAAGFALTGDFLASRDSLVSSVMVPEETAGAVLQTVGRAAIGASDYDDEVLTGFLAKEAVSETTELNALLSRSAVSWVVVLSLLVLFL
ncbi:MAG: regulatory signaling modulator protein AmpE [Halioglobus sp.]